MDLLVLKNISKSFKDDEGEEHGLKEVSISASKGESIYIQGNDGKSLSNLLMITGLAMRPDSGSIHVDSGEDTTAMKEKARASLRNMYFGYIGESFPLIDNWSAIRNVEVPLRYSKERPDITARRSRARELLDVVGLSERARNKVGSFTREERLKVQISRAFVNNPEIVLVDNPVYGLDHEAAERVMELIFRLCGAEMVLVAWGHNNDFSDRFTRRLVLKDGMLLQEYWGRDESAYTV